MQGGNLWINLNLFLQALLFHLAQFVEQNLRNGSGVNLSLAVMAQGLSC
jgi:hypothetical protein